MGLFDKKFCDVCGEKISLLGNKKLADGNLCKNCEAKLSPWFSERKQSTLQEIKEQLAYREENKEAVRVFHTTRTLGRNTKVLIDEDAKKFMVTSAGNLENANPDVLDFSQVTGCDVDVKEHKNEEKRKDKDGNMVSYNPPRYKYSYDFYMSIYVNHPYFNEISFRINSSAVETGAHSVYEQPQLNTIQRGTGLGDTLMKTVVAAMDNQSTYKVANAEYQDNMNIAEDIKSTLMQARQEIRDEIKRQNAPKRTIVCPYCGATTTPDSAGCCEYCGTAVPVDAI